MKQNILLLSGVILVIPQALLFAQWDKYEYLPPPQGSTSTSESDYWAEKKVQMQQRSTEMRKAKYTELQWKWVDVSSLTSDILDASKTEESVFWDILKKIQQTQEIKSRNEFLTKLANQGVDVSQFTDEVIADGQKFWDLVKKLQWAPRPQISDRPNANPKFETGGLLDKQSQEIANRKQVIAELVKAGIDTSGFTDEVIRNGDAFWKLMDYLKPKIESLKKWKKPETKEWDDSMKEREEEKWMKYGSGSEYREQMTKKETPMKASDRPALSEKARKLLQDKLDKIPSEKRDILLPKMLKTAQVQLKTAQTKSNKILIRKLEAIIEIIQDEIDSSDDSSLIDSLLTE